MRINNMIRKMYRTQLMLVALSLILAFNSGCTDKVIEWEPKSTEMVITDYVKNNPESFSEMGKILEYTGIENLLRVRGPFTLLLPPDAAMQEYYQKIGVSSYEEIDINVLKDLVYNHLFQGEISIGSIGQGSLLFENALGDFVASDFVGIDILLNKTAIITKRDIYTANGIIQQIDKVLEPVVMSVFDQLAAYDGYSIFLEGLEMAGLDDTLKLIEFPYGTATARTRYTLLAVPDTVYERAGINSVEELIAEFDTEDEPITHSNNGFYQYMEYHCLNGTYYFNDFDKNASYHMISYDNYLNIQVAKDYMINKNSDSYTGFYFEYSNIPAKNGVVHTVNTILEVEDSDLTAIIFQTTDYFDLQQGPYYRNYYQRFYDGQNQFEKIKWEGEFLLYYLKPDHNLMDDDCLNLNGHFWIEITTRKIRKGTYDLSGFFFFGGGHAVMSCFVDDQYLGRVDLTEGVWGGPPISFGEVTFTETKEHKIRLESINPGSCFWDYVRFKPKS